MRVARSASRIAFVICLTVYPRSGQLGTRTISSASSAANLHIWQGGADTLLINDWASIRGEHQEPLPISSGVNHPPLALSPLRSLVSRLAGHPYGDTESFPVEYVEQVSHVTSLDPKGTASHHVLFKPMFSDIGQRDKAHQGAMLVNAEIRLNGLRHGIIISFSAPFVLAVDS